MIQKKLVRIIIASRPFEHSAPLFKSLHILTISEINEFCSSLYACKCLLCLHHGIFELVRPHGHLTRLSARPVIPLPTY